MQDFASVLPDRDFVQTAQAAQNKFKSSVADALHNRGKKVPNWNKLTTPPRHHRRRQGNLCR
jgi:hypothetical protein